MNKNRVYGYIRVSTVKQGLGVSLIEQKSSIEQYAQKNDLNIIKWFEEKETAAKSGRPIFSSMLASLRKNEADGVIIHKIDRSARNLRDWASLGELIDDGKKIHFSHEAVDLTARGGRLSADLLAVISADYVRNLRQETLKGFYGRLKQGIYPLKAPVGYLDMGGGKVKEVDPIKGPLILQAFELYATGHYSLNSLRKKMAQLGLTNSQGLPYSKNTFSVILHNSFYIGLIPIRKSGEIFDGKHKPIVSTKIFQEVQDVLEGKLKKGPIAHKYPYRKMIRCANCQRSIIGELHKGWIYYRCGNRNCKKVSIRQDRFEYLVSRRVRELSYPHKSYCDIKLFYNSLKHQSAKKLSDQARVYRMSLGKITSTIDKLTDSLIDGLLEKDEYTRRKKELLLQQKPLQEKLEQTATVKPPSKDDVRKYIELLRAFDLKAFKGNSVKKRQIVKILTSNLILDGKKLTVSMPLPFSLMNCDDIVTYSPPYQTTNEKTDRYLDGFSKKSISKKDAEIVARKLHEFFSIPSEERDGIEELIEITNPDSKSTKSKIHRFGQN